LKIKTGLLDVLVGIASDEERFTSSPTGQEEGHDAVENRMEKRFWENISGTSLLRTSFRRYLLVHWAKNLPPAAQSIFQQ
jgi:hypothetical protein